MHRSPRLSSEEKRRLAEAVERFPRCRILTAGDLMLDTFIWGEVHRISPEAPVPVVEVREETQLLGGTANVVRNIATLGGQTMVSGVIGNDTPGRDLMRLLTQIGVPTGGIVIEQDRPTTIKTRVIAQNQQVVRFDREQRTPLRRESLDQVLVYIQEQLSSIDGLIVSDYAKGLVTLDFMEALRTLASRTSLPVLVDPKVRDVNLYRRVTMITPNHHEAARMSGVEIRDEETLVQAGRLLLDQLECQTVLITRGKEGMSLFDQTGQVSHLPTVARRVYDVTGAGDTVIAAIALGTAAGLSPMEAALLANLAAGIVVGEVGTAAVSSNQLLHAIHLS